MSPRMKLAGWVAGVALALSPCAARAQNVLITEFLASNRAANADEDGDFSDWTELYNSGNDPVSLDGWYLTDSASNKMKWRFPNVTIGPKQFLVVYNSDKDRRDPAAPLHTNWKLSADGEYLGLIRADGVTVESEYAPKFPPQQTDVSYGMAFSGTAAALLPAGADAWVYVPTNDALGTNWTTSDNTTGWRAGTSNVGFERSTGYESLFSTDVGDQMYGITSSVYIRIPFTLAETPNGTVSLRMKYDDGFVAYLNGVRVASANAPARPNYASEARRTHDDALAIQWEEFDISSYRSLLRPGQNVLAIHGLNAGASSSDFLISSEIVGLEGTSVSPDARRFFAVPTPGRANGTASTDRGPEVGGLAHTPQQPNEDQNLVVTARVAPVSGPITTVTLTYRVDFGNPVNIPMADNGASGDGVAGDGVYGATIPASTYGPGQMVRYYVTAADAAHSTRNPLFVNASASPEYQGTVARDPALTSPLPVLQWFIQNPPAADTETGTQASIFYNGVLYDNVHVRLRGQTSAAWPKKNFKFDMNAGFYFDYDPTREPVEEFNLQSTYSDKSYIRQILSWDAFAAAGVPGCIAFPLRVQQNNTFYSVGVFVEQPDETMLSRNKLDADGALYKMYNGLTSATEGVEKKTREEEDNNDLQLLVNGMQRSNLPLRQFLFDNVNLPEVINYLAVSSVIHENDAPEKNYYMYRDSDGTGEWQMLPWDKDLTFGRNFVPWDGGVLADEIWADNDPYSHPLFGDHSHPKVDGPYNRLIDALYRDATTRTMYLRRLRTVMDLLLQDPSTPLAERRFEARINELVNLMAGDVALDRARWGNPYGADQDFAQAVALITDNYLPRRRAHLFTRHSAQNRIIPAAQTAALPLYITDLAPESGKPEEGYIAITNPNVEAVDISGWKLEGDVRHTFHPGTVVTSNNTIYVAADVRSFRLRPTGPSGNQALFVQGNFRGRLSPVGPFVELQRPDGARVHAWRGVATDIAEALRLAAGISTLDADQTARLNTDGPEPVVDVLDAIRIARRLAGLETAN